MGFFPFLSFILPLCFLEGKSVKNLKIHSVLSRQKGKTPYQANTVDVLDFKANGNEQFFIVLFSPLSLVKIYLKCITVEGSAFIMPDLFLCVLTLDPLALL